jgi:hypothetical protein
MTRDIPASVRGGESRLWRVVETRKIAGKYEKSRCFALMQYTGLIK